MDYVVTIGEDIDVNEFIDTLRALNFELLQCFAFGVLIVKNNGRLEELKALEGVNSAELEKSVRGL